MLRPLLALGPSVGKPTGGGGGGQVCWLSVDPVRRKVNFYPKAIAARIESSYGERDPWAPSTCVLGSDFFNATVHFHPSGICYQTTPGASMGRAGYKQPGYRSVMRYVREAGVDRVVIFSKQVHGEWRIAANEAESEIRFDELLPLDVLVDANAKLGPAEQHFLPWHGSDITSGAWGASVVVWQWCRGVKERQGSNLESLGDEWWCPYLAAENRLIEEAFVEKAEFKEVRLPSMDRVMRIEFTRGQSYALQYSDEDKTRERLVRRVVKTVTEVKDMLDRMASQRVDVVDLASRVPEGTIPHHFFCPIFQDVMDDPVKTVDGHTYDRAAIERWFNVKQTSPLTGLTLPSADLKPNTELKEQIREWMELNADL